MAAQPVIAYWLMPAPDHRELKSLVRGLARRFDAPEFEPHLTVHVADAPPAAEAPPKDARALVDAAAAGIQPIALTPAGIGYSETFTESLFVRFDRSRAIETLHRALRDGSPRPSAYTLKPHLSLLYARIDRAVLRGLAATITLPSGVIVFDSLAAVSATSPTEARSDVLAWRKLYTRKLP